ncbi:MAG: class I SAM-dependent methyltransferase [Chitinophagaceae bacterium]|nr:class I SAM-dependent methyltransferase [Chitinophagaceae bacterium]
MLKKLRWKIAQFAERRWWKNYLKDKDPLDYKDWKRDYWKGIMASYRSVALVTDDMSVLDAGCGPSGIFMMFPKHNVTAFDPLLDKYAADLDIFNPKQYPKTKFVKAGLEDFKSEEKFHRVFCMNAINHVQDIEKSVDTLVNHTTSNGCIIITIDAHNYSFFKYLFRLLPGDILHPHQYDRMEYKEMFTKRGCKFLNASLLKKDFLFNHYLLTFKRIPQ